MKHLRCIALTVVEVDPCNPTKLEVENTAGHYCSTKVLLVVKGILFVKTREL